MVEVTDEVRLAVRDYFREVSGSVEGLETLIDGLEDGSHIVQTFARIYQRGKLEGARLALEAAERAVTEWFPYETDGAVGSIRALSPAKIVGEG